MRPSTRISVELLQPALLPASRDHFWLITILRFKFGSLDRNTADAETTVAQQHQRPRHIGTDTVVVALAYNRFRSATGQPTARTHDIPGSAGQVGEQLVHQRFSSALALRMRQECAFGSTKNGHIVLRVLRERECPAACSPKASGTTRLVGIIALDRCSGVSEQREGAFRRTR